MPAKVTLELQSKLSEPAPTIPRRAAPPPIPALTLAFPSKPSLPRSPSEPSEPAPAAKQDGDPVAKVHHSAASEKPAPAQAVTASLDEDPSTSANEDPRPCAPPPRIAPPRVDESKPATADPGDFIQALDAAFEEVLEEEGAQVRQGRLELDEREREEVRALLSSMAAHHLTAVRDFVIELSMGPMPGQWVEISMPAVVSLRKAAKRTEHPELASRIEAFEDMLNRVCGANQMVDGVDRELVLAAYEAMQEVLPEAFDLGDERDRREPIIVHRLLQATSGVHPLLIDRLYAAGLTSLSVFYRASAAELQAATGIEASICQSIARTFRTYRNARSEVAAEAARDAEKNELRELNRRLSVTEQDFAMAEKMADDTRRRILRRERQKLWGQAEILLAQLGEVDLIEELKRFPVRRKISRLERFLAGQEGAPRAAVA